MKKKILYIITKSNFGGAQRYVFELATSLPKDQYDVTVAFGGNGLLKQKLEKNGIRTHTIQSFERDVHIKKEWSSLFEIHALIKELRPDIVHLNSSKAGGAGAFIARLARVSKIVYTAHGWPFHERKNIVWKSTVWVLSYITAILSHTIILVSLYDRKNMYMPFVSKKCTVIKTALPRIDFLSRDASREILFTDDVSVKHESDFWLATIAELTPNKNIFSAITAVAEYNKKNPSKRIFYTIIGDGEQRSEFQEYLMKHGLNEDIHLAGYVPDARTYLQAFDAFLLPSYKEGMPYAILEAGSAGLPVIASNVGGIPEIITHEENGLLVDPAREKSIEEALTQIVQNVDITKTYSRRLKEKISTTFTLDDMLEKTIAVYGQE